MVKQRKNQIPAPSPDCPLEEALTFLAGAWTPKILWYLHGEPRRFGDLKRDLGTISSKVLATRLKELESRGAITRTEVPTSPPTVEYALTSVGRKLLPILDAIVDVGTQLRKPKSAGTRVALL